jgi:hypothetical protein
VRIVGWPQRLRLRLRVRLGRDRLSKKSSQGEGQHLGLFHVVGAHAAVGEGLEGVVALLDAEGTAVDVHAPATGMRWYYGMVWYGMVWYGMVW